MPLIDITTNRDYTESEAGIHEIIKRQLAKVLPELLVINAKELGLEPSIHPAGIQVMNHNFGMHDVNVPDVWVKVQFGAEPPTPRERQRIRDALYTIVLDWFARQRHVAPDDFVLELFWVPTSGKGVVNGVEIAW